VNKGSQKAKVGKVCWAEGIVCVQALGFPHPRERKPGWNSEGS